MAVIPKSSMHSHPLDRSLPPFSVLGIKPGPAPYHLSLNHIPLAICFTTTPAAISDILGSQGVPIILQLALWGCSPSPIPSPHPRCSPWPWHLTHLPQISSVLLFWNLFSWWFWRGEDPKCPPLPVPRLPLGSQFKAARDATACVSARILSLAC